MTDPITEYRVVIHERPSTSAGPSTCPGQRSKALSTVGEVVEQHRCDDLHVEEIRLLVQWLRPLHVVHRIDHREATIVYVTLYEPDLDHWRPSFERRRT